MDSTPLGKVFNEDNETNEEFIKFKKESSSKKWIVHSIKLERKKAHQGEIIFWKSIKLWENTNSSKNTRDMKFHKRSFKLRRISKNEDSSREKSNQMRKMRKRKKKDTFHQPKKKVCSITSRKMKVH